MRIPRLHYARTIRLLLLDLSVLGPPVCLVLMFLAIAGSWLVRGRPTVVNISGAGQVFVLILIVNCLEYAVFAIHILGRHLTSADSESHAFWAGMVSRHFLGGALLYYLVRVRGWRPEGPDGESYRRSFRLDFLRSRFTRVIRVINRLWVPLYLVLLGTAVFLAPQLPSDSLFEVSMRASVAVLLVGGIASSHFVFILARDAVVRSYGLPAERDVATEIYSSFFTHKAAERYFRMIARLESSRGA